MIFNECFTFETRVNNTISKKTQILLLNTNAHIQDYLAGLSLRYFGKYNKIPAFTIAKDGEVFKHYNPENTSNLIPRVTSSHIIFIALENIGWLLYDEKNKTYYDWKNNIFSGDVFKKVWRNKEYWDKYSEVQINELNKLLDYLCIEYLINKNVVGHNTYIVDCNNYNGILVRSNYGKEYYDLSPAFDFTKIIK